MYSIIFNKYVTLVFSIALLYYFIFIFNLKIKGDYERFWKRLGLVTSITCLLVALAEIMSLDNILIYPICVGMFIIFALLMVNAWKIRKIPKARKLALSGLIIMGIFILFVIVVIILSKLGFYG